MTLIEFLFAVVCIAQTVLASLIALELRNIRACLETQNLQASKRRQWIRQEHTKENLDG
jgi:hypothetical protein